jgi:hypothetical protein
MPGTTPNTTTHRGCSFSITELDNGKWRWTLHPQDGDKAQKSKLYGTISGNRDAAIEAAHAAIENQKL